MKRLPHNIDVHAHTGPLRVDAVLCVDPVDSDSLPEGNGLLSVGIHPWNAAKADGDTWKRLNAWLDDPRVIAVGEIGLDRLRGPEISFQKIIFERQAIMAATHHLPVVIHCVRAYDLLLNLRKNLLKEFHSVSPQWIIHGFRGKPQLARQLLDAGIDLSFGTIYNPESYAITPSDRRYHETDS